MLAVLSPAKKMNFAASKVTSNDLPRFSAEIEALIAVLKSYDVSAIKSAMNLSDALSQLNFERFQEFDPSFSNDITTAAAIEAFQGDVYQALHFSDFSVADTYFCQQNIAILSGLYGLLRPLDLIQAYRLEMKTKISTTQGKDLYAFWGDKIALAINEILEQHEYKVLLNLASNEYFKAISLQALKFPVINIDFKEYKNGTFKTIGIAAKKARGLMARYIIKNKISKPSLLYNFTAVDYSFNESMSNETNLVFSRMMS